MFLCFTGFKIVLTTNAQDRFSVKKKMTLRKEPLGLLLIMLAKLYAIVLFFFEKVQWILL